MFVFKKYDRQNHVWSFITKYLRFLCKFMSWSGDIYVRFLKIFYSETTGKFTLAMYFYLGQE